MKVYAASECQYCKCEGCFDWNSVPVTDKPTEYNCVHCGKSFWTYPNPIELTAEQMNADTVIG